MTGTDSTVILAKDLTKHFGEIVAVKNVNLRIARGELFGLVGPDGAGKTTLIRLLCGALPADEGAAELAGFDVQKQPNKVNERVGYVSQRSSLYGDLTVAENLAFSAQIHSMPRKAMKQKEERLLEFAGLSQFRRRLAQDLSGGMRQKLGLICALIHSPEILLLDEPSTGVDAVSRREFWRILYDLLSQGHTILISTPYLDEAERCHRVAIMYEGEIMLCDTVPKIKARVGASLWELVCQPQHEARKILSQLDFVTSVQTFGDKLHVSLRDLSLEPETFLAPLRSQGIKVASFRLAPPNLEDAFFSLISSGK